MEKCSGTITNETRNDVKNKNYAKFRANNLNKVCSNGIHYFKTIELAFFYTNYTE